MLAGPLNEDKEPYHIEVEHLEPIYKSTHTLKEMIRTKSTTNKEEEVWMFDNECTCKCTGKFSLLDCVMLIFAPRNLMCCGIGPYHPHGCDFAAPASGGVPDGYQILDGDNGEREADQTTNVWKRFKHTYCSNIYGILFLFMMMCLLISGFANVADSIMDDPDATSSVTASKCVRVASNIDHLFVSTLFMFLWILIPNRRLPSGKWRIHTLSKSKFIFAVFILLMFTNYGAYIAANYDLKFSKYTWLGAWVFAYIFPLYAFYFAFYFVTAMLLEDKKLYFQSLDLLLETPNQVPIDHDMTALLNVISVVFARRYWKLIEVTLLVSLALCVLMAGGFCFALFYEDYALRNLAGKVFFAVRTFSPIITNTICMLMYMPILKFFEKLREMLLAINDKRPVDRDEDRRRQHLDAVRIRSFGHYLPFSRTYAMALQGLTLVGPVVAVIVKSFM